MEDKEAVEILAKMVEQHQFSKKEKQAILTAIGILSWSKLGQARIKSIAKKQKEKREGYLKNNKEKFS